jgi:hypothetical protein
MKHLKIFEEFIAESDTPSPDLEKHFKSWLKEKHYDKKYQRFTFTSKRDKDTEWFRVEANDITLPKLARWVAMKRYQSETQFETMWKELGSDIEDRLFKATPLYHI